MTKTNATTKRIFPLMLIVVLLASLLCPVSVYAAGPGYYDIISVYAIEGVDRNVETMAIAYLYGSATAAAQDNYAIVIKLHRSGEGYIDVIDGATFNQLLDNSLTSSRMQVEALNEYLLTLGAPDEYLFLNEKPYFVRELESAAAAGQRGSLKVDDVLAVGPEELRYAAENGFQSVNFDSMYRGSVDVRLTVNPANCTKGMAVAAAVVDYDGHKVLENFQRLYSNNFACIDFFQENSFGTTVQVAAKIDLGGLNTSNLVFYNYNAISNNYSRMENTNYSVDASGYLHFSTTVGNTVLITDRELVRR